jgi:hypothetical protein
MRSCNQPACSTLVHGLIELMGQAFHTVERPFCLSYEHEASKTGFFLAFPVFRQRRAFTTLVN